MAGGKKGFFGRLFGKKGKDTGGNAGQAQSPANENRLISAQPMQMQQTPAFWQIGSDYNAFAEKAANFASNEKAKHAKKTELDAMAREKKALDDRYTEAVNTPVEMKGMDFDLADEKETMEQRKSNADEVWSSTEEKAQKQIAAREQLEKYRGSSTMAVIKHAKKMSEQDQQADAPQPSTEKTRAANARNAANAEKEKKDKREGHEGRAGFAGAIMSILSAIWSSISDGKSAVKGIAGVAEDEVTGTAVEQLKKNAGGAEGGLNNMAAIMSLFNAILSAIGLGRSIAKAAKNVDNFARDGQERWLDCRTILQNITDLFGNLVGAAAPFIDLVPFLGPSLNIAVSGMQIVVSSMNLGSNIYHKHQTEVQKEELWAQIERKRKKYTGVEAGYFDIAPGETKRKRSWSKIDQKRKMLRQIVGVSMGADRGTVESRKWWQTKTNQTYYADAEARISTRISAYRDRWHKGELTESAEEYKKKMHAMEALELMAQYRNVEKAQKKMNKSIGHDVENLLTSSTKVVGNAMVLAGEITAASGAGLVVMGAGKAVVTAEDIYEMLRGVYGMTRTGIRKTFGAEQNKENTRGEMAAYLYDKMLSLAPPHAEWAGEDFFKLDATVPDYKVREMGRSVEELNNILRKGLDARISDIMATKNSSIMKEALASAFGQG